MRTVAKVYDAVIMALATIAGAMVAAVFVAIVYDVMVRTMGYQPPFWTSALTEYALLYMTLLAAPWMVRIGGHVYVESFVATLPRWLFRSVERLVYVLCIAICFVLAYYAAALGYDVYLRGEMDYRSVIIPRWVLFAILPVGFTLSGIEFLRFLFGKGSMYGGERSAPVDSV